MGGSIADILSINNAVEIDSVQKSLKQQLKLQEFKERADAITRRTGIEPVGFFEYSRTNPVAREHGRFAEWIMGAAGALLGGSFGLVIGEGKGKPVSPYITGFAAAGGVSGFIAGLFVKEDEVTHFNRVLDKYDAYLTGLASAPPAIARTHAPETHKEHAPKPQGHHTARLEASREATEQATTPQVG